MADIINKKDAGIGGPQKKGSGFTNLSRYLQANEGNKLGQAVTTGIKNETGKVKQDIGQSKEKFSAGLQQQQLGTSADKENSARILSGAQTATDEDVNKFKNYLSGPSAELKQMGQQGLSNSAGIQSAAQRTAKLAGDVSNTPGQMNLLQRFAAGNQQYTGGQKRLDSLLFGANVDRSALQGARRQALAISPEAQAAQAAALGQGQQALGQAQQFAEETKKQLSGAQNAVTAEAADQARQFNKKSQAAQGIYDQLQATIRGQAGVAIGSPEYYQQIEKLERQYRNPGIQSPEDQQSDKINLSRPGMSNLGTPQQKQSELVELAKKAVEYGLDPAAVLSPSLQYEQAGPVKEQQFIDEQKASRLNALARLGGVDQAYQAFSGQLPQIKAGLDAQVGRQAGNRLLDPMKQQWAAESAPIQARYETGNQHIQTGQSRLAQLNTELAQLRKRGISDFESQAKSASLKSEIAKQERDIENARRDNEQQSQQLAYYKNLMSRGF